jgi:hypothetical protein
VACHQDSVPKVIGNLLVTLNQRHLKVYEQAVKSSLDVVVDLDERRALEDRLSSVLYVGDLIVLSLPVLNIPSSQGSSSDLMTSMHGANDADASLRVAAIQKILDALDLSEGSSPDTDAVVSPYSHSIPSQIEPKNGIGRFSPCPSYRNRTVGVGDPLQ